MGEPGAAPPAEFASDWRRRYSGLAAASVDEQSRLGDLQAKRLGGSAEDDELDVAAADFGVDCLVPLEELGEFWAQLSANLALGGPVELPRLIRRLTPFTHDIFASLNKYLREASVDNA